jgi:hypothetical protein
VAAHFGQFVKCSFADQPLPWGVSQVDFPVIIMGDVARAGSTLTNTWSALRAETPQNAARRAILPLLAHPAVAVRLV